MIRWTWLYCLAAVLLLGHASVVRAVESISSADVSDEIDAPFGTLFAVPGIEGTVVLGGSESDPIVVRVVLALAGGSEATVAIVTSSVDRSESLKALIADGGATAVQVQPEDVRNLNDFDAVWLDDQSPMIGQVVRSYVDDGGVLAATGSTAEWLGQWHGDATTAGLSVLPGFMVDVSERSDEVFEAELARCSGGVGVRVSKQSVAHVTGRRLHVSVGSAAALIPAGAGRSMRTVRITNRRPADLVTLSRASVARARGESPNPGDEPEVPAVVEGGTLYIAGGGRPNGRAMRRFIAAAGGAEARIAVIPTALGGSDERAGAGDVRLLRAAGAADVRIVHAATPEAAERKDLLDALREATGIWFSGGRQWRLVDSYLDTTAHELIHDVLRRGGAVGGSSAGASIQASYMVRGHPLGNTVMMAEGYERGLGLLPGVAIDQHFTQRGRQLDMVGLKKRFPKLLGIGIDESTGIFVTGHILEVVGSHTVSLYDRSDAEGADELTLLRAGDRYDLAARQKLDSASHED